MNMRVLASALLVLVAGADTIWAQVQYRCCPYELVQDLGNGYGQYKISKCNISTNVETSDSTVSVIKNTNHLHRCKVPYPSPHDPSTCRCFPCNAVLRMVCLGEDWIQQIYLDPEVKAGLDKFANVDARLFGVETVGNVVTVRFKKDGEARAQHFATLRTVTWKDEGKRAALYSHGFEVPAKDGDYPEAEVKYQDQAYYVLKVDGELYHVFTTKSKIVP